VISQSGAFWWAPEDEEYEWLARHVASTAAREISFYLDAGRLEDGPNPDTGLSMLTVTRHLRDVLRARGYPVRYQEFSGGQDPIGWRTTLPDAIRHFLGR
jgi:enterochelin esterase family protein